MIFSGSVNVIYVVFVFNVPPTAKVIIWRRGPRLKVSSDRLVTEPGIEPAIPGLRGKRFIHYTTAAPVNVIYMDELSKLNFAKKWK